MQNNKWIVVFLLMLLTTLLAACGGSDAVQEAPAEDSAPAAEEADADGMEATGSESSDGAPLPTPLSGAKVTGTRAAAAAAQPINVLIIVDRNNLLSTTISNTTTLTAVTEQLLTTNPPIAPAYALAAYGGGNTAVAPQFLTLPAQLTPLNPPTNNTLPNILTRITQQITWPANQPGLIIWLAQPPAAVNTAVLANTLTAQPNTRLLILQGQAPTTTNPLAEIAAAANGRILYWNSTTHTLYPQSANTWPTNYPQPTSEKELLTSLIQQEQAPSSP